MDDILWIAVLVMGAVIYIFGTHKRRSNITVKDVKNSTIHIEIDGKVVHETKNKKNEN